MPVSAWMAGGMLHSGLTSELHSLTCDAVVDPDDADLRDPVVAGDGAGRFKVDEGDGWGEHELCLTRRTIVR